MYNEDLGPDSPIIKGKNIEVLVSITLSKTFKIKVNDYKNLGTYKDEDGNTHEDIDYSECNLKEAVKEQIILPHEVYKTIIANTERGKKAYEDLKGWNVDDYEVVLE